MRLDRNMVFLRSFAECNQTKSELLQQKIENDVVSESTSDGKRLSLFVMGRFCVMIPPIHEYPAQFAELFFDALIDRCIKTELENAKVLNWCTPLKHMYPLITKSDGNCLLHAVSMAMWGIEDTHLVLRRLLHQSLLDDMGGMFRKRWLLENKYLDETFIPDLELTTQNWEEEWNIVLQLANNENLNPTADCLFYTSLEEIHLFVLANVLKRPIIVHTEPVIRSLTGMSLQENTFAGIYLPLHWPPSSCHKSPLVLAFNMNHFTPLVSMVNSYSEDMSSSRKQAVPLMNADLSSLRMHYLLHDEETQANQLLKNYLKLCDVIVKTNVIVTAKIVPHTLPAEYDLVKDYVQDCELKYRSFKQISSDIHNASNAMRSPLRDTSRKEAYAVVRNKAPQCKNMSAELRAYAGKKAVVISRKCIIEYCQSYGSHVTADMCSKCFSEKTYLNSVMSKVEETTPVLNDLSVSNALSAHQNQVAQELVSGPFNTVGQCTEDLPSSVPVSDIKEQPFECPEEFYTSAAPISDVWHSGSVTDLKASSPEPGIQPVTIASKNFYPQQGKVVQAENISAAAQTLAVTSNNRPEEASVTLACESPSAHGTLPVRMNEVQAQIPSTRVAEHSTCNRNTVAEESCQVSGQESTLCIRCNSERTSDLTPTQQTIVQYTHHRQGCLDQYTGVEVTQYPEQSNLNSNIPTESRTIYNPTKQRDVKSITSTAQYKGYADHMGQQHRQTSSAVAAAANAHLPANTQMRTTRGVEAAVCWTKDCMGYPLENPKRLCHFCYQQTKEGKTPVPNVPAYRQEDRSEGSGRPTPIAASTRDFDLFDIPPGTVTPHVYAPINCLEPIEESLGNRRKCASPLCHSMVSLEQELCKSCIHILAKYTQHRIAKVPQPEYGDKIHRCITAGCKYYGAPEFGGHCSQCFARKSVMEARENHAESKQPHGRVIACLEYEQPAASVYAPAIRGDLCALAGCSRFGDPSYSQLCSRCYHDRQEIQQSESHQVHTNLRYQQDVPSLNLTLNAVGSTTKETRKQMNGQFQQNIPFHDTYAASQPGARFEQAMTKVERRHKWMKCKRENCTNFGNPSSCGYCNSCYVALRGIDVID